MGNCMETKRGKERSEESKEVKVKSENGHMTSKNGGGGGGVRVKVLVTKEELQWLMSKLSNSNKRSIDDVLIELENHGRKRLHGWKPSLDSIPEVLETHT